MDASKKRPSDGSKPPSKKSKLSRQPPAPYSKTLMILAKAADQDTLGAYKDAGRYLSNFTPVPGGLEITLTDDKACLSVNGTSVSALYPVTLPQGTYRFASIEGAYQGIKAACYTQISDLARKEVLERFLPVSGLEAKSMGGKKGFGKLGLCLSVERWAKDVFRVMKALVKARMEQDSRYREIVCKAEAEGVFLWHFVRGKQPWEAGTGRYLEANENMLGPVIRFVAKEF